MDNISKALIIAIHYLAETRNDKDFTEDDDLEIAEEVTSIILASSKEERESILRAINELGVPELAKQLGLKDGT